jgi:hypothetical protein
LVIKFVVLAENIVRNYAEGDWVSILRLPAKVLEILAVVTLWNASHNLRELMEPNSSVPDCPFSELPHIRPEVYVTNGVSSRSATSGAMQARLFRMYDY